MEYVGRLLQTCSSIQKATTVAPSSATDATTEEAVSEVQLNAFEFRNYRSSLEAPQHQLLERIVNQWCVSLVKGKTLKVNGNDERVFVDKDLLGLELGADTLKDHEYYPLKDMSRLEMFRDPDPEEGWPYCVVMTFRSKLMLAESKRGVQRGEWDLRFNFRQEQQRLNFALTLRILRTRDPMLDTNQPLEVLGKDEDEEEEEPAFGRIVNTFHYNVDTGIPVVFSVSDLKLYMKLQSISRQVYLEFFVRYPRQDRFLYAKSSTAPIPPKALLTEEETLRKRKENRAHADENDDRRRNDKQQTVNEIPIESMTFDLKNVKIKVPKIPHTIFGRLMAKDEFFPAAVGSFDFDIKRSYLVDRRQGHEEDSVRKEPEVLSIPVWSTWKMPTPGDKDDFVKIGLLTIRVLGYVTSSASNTSPTASPKADVAGAPRKRSGSAVQGSKSSVTFDMEGGEVEPKTGDNSEASQEEAISEA